MSHRIGTSSSNCPHAATASVWSTTNIWVPKKDLSANSLLESRLVVGEWEANMESQYYQQMYCSVYWCLVLQGNSKNQYRTLEDSMLEQLFTISMSISHWEFFLRTHFWHLHPGVILYVLPPSLQPQSLQIYTMYALWNAEVSASGTWRGHQNHILQNCNSTKTGQSKVQMKVWITYYTRLIPN